MTIIFRESKKVEPRLLRELYQFAPWAKDRSLPDIKKVLMNSTLVFSAWDGKKLVGFARVLTDKTFRATIWDVIVIPEYQNRGIGSSLIKRIISHPGMRNVDRYWLNTKQPEFYEKFGFERSSEAMVLKPQKKKR